MTELKEKYSIRVFPQQKHITTEFPYKGKISVLFSIMKVYPALNKFAKENEYNENSSVMEIYDVPNKKNSLSKRDKIIEVLIVLS